MTTYNDQSYNKYNENITQSKSQERAYNNSKSDHSERITKDSMGNRTNNRDRNEPSDNNIRTWYGGLIKKPERLTYN